MNLILKLLIILQLGNVLLVLGQGRGGTDATTNTTPNKKQKTEFDGCTFIIENILKSPEPLILVQGGKEFYYPDSTGTISVPYDKKIEFYCQNYFKNTIVRSRVLTCDRDKKTFVPNLNLITQCEKTNSYTDCRTGGKCYKNTATLAEIGYEVSGKDYAANTQCNKFTRFISVMSVCYDETNERTIYSQHKINPLPSMPNVLDVDFKKGNFHNSVSMATAYDRKNQVMALEKALGNNFDQYVCADKYLARGHLAAKSDFFYGPQQKSTFMYINAAPQWQSFNVGNWLTIETAIRDFAENNALTFEVFSGTWGVAKLPNDKNQDVALYLVAGNKVPIPKFYYKMVVAENDGKKEGVVFVGVNNPYLKNIDNEYKICKDISDKLTWINKRKQLDIHSGYWYACEISDFVKTVDHFEGMAIINSISGMLGVK